MVPRVRGRFSTRAPLAVWSPRVTPDVRGRVIPSRARKSASSRATCGLESGARGRRAELARRVVKTKRFLHAPQASSEMECTMVSCPLTTRHSSRCSTRCAICTGWLTKPPASERGSMHTCRRVCAGTTATTYPCRRVSVTLPMKLSRRSRSPGCRRRSRGGFTAPSSEGQDAEADRAGVPSDANRIPSKRRLLQRAAPKEKPQLRPAVGEYLVRWSTSTRRGDLLAGDRVRNHERDEQAQHQGYPACGRESQHVRSLLDRRK